LFLVMPKTPRFAFRKEKAAKKTADIMDRKPEI